ncbi:hypothetical protein VN97_g13085 [Penicillium thymicola]|uniref:Uncharacterized protein n=1 Tax=Penicillium thymicola TaxID=293382 RepID=A0AAI9T4G9_PENTH|nr:hypothetical protein VN97_g13085 [Penicillium thymicola]
MNIFIASRFFASFHPKADVTNEPPGGAYFHVVLNKETWVLILINLHEVETIFEGHIACFVDVLPESLVARLLPFSTQRHLAGRHMIYSNTIRHRHGPTRRRLTVSTNKD